MTETVAEKGRGVWVYAICRGLDAEVLGELRGVDGETPRALGPDELTAVVGSVDLERFSADGLRRSLNDLDLLTAMARAHHAVVEAAATTRPTAPARLATVYDDDDGVLEMLADHRDSLTAALDHVAGRQEWGVKAYVAGRPGAANEPAAAAPTTGTAYLSQRRNALQAREASQRQVTAGAGALAERLVPLAVDVHRHRPQDPQLSGDTRTMVLNDAYLVEADDAEAFANTVNGLADAHPELAVELTGPWPPYSFAVIEEVNP
jgi:Gas vesicle synthesis protein GvpL/GvpF